MIEPSVIELYKQLFITRSDTFALQRSDGRYIRVPAPVTDLLIQAHLEGYITAGWYALAGDQCRWLCFDADQDEDWQALRELQKEMARDDLPTHLEHSRRGGHLWLFFQETVLAAQARRLGLSYLDRLNIDMELYPRQAQARYGSLVRGPLGVHRLSGERYSFAYRGNIAAQLRLLTEQRAPVTVLPEVSPIDQVKQTGPMVVWPRRRPVQHDSPIARLNTVLDIWELASQVTHLDPRTGMGSCPFHPPDRHPSFAVNRREGWWICFHGEDGNGKKPMGGDAFELYCRLHGLSHCAALTQLRALLFLSTQSGLFRNLREKQTACPIAS